VPPEAFNDAPESLILKPLDKKSLLYPVVSASVVFGNNALFATLYVSLDESINCQSPPLSVLFVRTKAGLNPVKQKGPSAEPLPV
jgi:hypothetical protein